MAANAFSLPVRERFLALLAVEYSTEEAAATAGISRQTVARWAARGRVPGARAEHADFAARLDAIREGMAEAVAEAEADELDDAWSKVLRGDPYVGMEVAARPGCHPELTEAQERVAEAVSDAVIASAKLPPAKRDRDVLRALRAGCKAQRLPAPEGLL
jgi:hypothetical protein